MTLAATSNFILTAKVYRTLATERKKKNVTFADMVSLNTKMDYFPFKVKFLNGIKSCNNSSHMFQSHMCFFGYQTLKVDI